jgi:5-methylcytosine-specific restriction endonuclease McrA
MGGIRALGGIHRRDEGESRTEKRLASVGLASRERREPLYPQAGPALAWGTAPRGAVSVENVLRLLEHQQYRCALTGRRLTPQTASLDHIVPVRLGGEHAIENTQVLHKDVNRAKGALTNEEFRAMCREVVAWADSSKTHRTIGEEEEERE